MSNVPTAITDELLGSSGRLHVISNRGPVTFERDSSAPAGLLGERGPGGLVTALGDLGRFAPVTWIAAALTDGDRDAAPALRAIADPSRNGNRDAVARRVRELVDTIAPGQDLDLRLETLPAVVHKGHYSAFANPFLWFLQHQMYALPYEPNVDRGLLEAWKTGYRPANRILAEAALDAAKGTERPVFLPQDYHLYLAAGYIRERRPDALILHFTHIPWPPVSTWQVVPQSIRRPICEGILGADIVGMQTDRYASNFLDAVTSFVPGAHVDGDGRSVRWHDRRIRVPSYPISVDPVGLLQFAHSAPVEQAVAGIRERAARAGNPRLIVRADRIEPSKNVLRGFLAFEELLRRRPKLCRGVRFIAVQAETRAALPEYVRYAAAVHDVVARINAGLPPDEQPIWLYDGTDYAMAIAALRVADVILVNPVIDGMNLVAKEGVLVGEHDPVLILSETAGAAEQLALDALPVAPADIVGTSEQLERALEMPSAERHQRALHLRASVRAEDIGWWLSRQMRDLVAIRRGELPPSRRLRDSVRRVEATVGEATVGEARVGE